MIMEMLTWLQLQSANVAAEQNASNFLILGYLFLYLKTRKVGLPLAFLFSELLFNTSITDLLNNTNYYLAQSFFDCVVISVIFNKSNNKINVLYLMMITTNLGMCNEEIQGLGETYLYNNYSNIILFIHVFIIISASNFKWYRDAESTVLNFISNIVYNKSYSNGFKTNPDK